jgi:hypothetical protein
MRPAPAVLRFGAGLTFAEGALGAASEATFTLPPPSSKCSPRLSRMVLSRFAVMAGFGFDMLHLKGLIELYNRSASQM